jgi:hypothetical protein
VCVPATVVDASHVAGMLMLSQLSLLPLITLLFSIATAYYEINVAAAIGAAIDHAVY